MPSSDINKFDIVKNNPDWMFIIRDLKFDYQDYDESHPHKHKFYQFILFEKGDGTHLIDEKEYPLKDKSIHFISPNHVHLLKISSKTKGIICMFKEDLFYINNETQKFLNDLNLFSNWNNRPTLKIDTHQFESFHQLLVSLKNEYNSQERNKNEVLLMLLKLFLIKASRLSSKNKEKKVSRKQILIDQFLGLIEENHANNIPVNIYAKQLNISAPYLNRLIKEFYDKNASDFINDRNILEAKRFLKFSPKSIKEIAFDLGFDDPSYFSRFFKKKTELTPLQYRNQNIKK